MEKVLANQSACFVTDANAENSQHLKEAHVCVDCNHHQKEVHVETVENPHIRKNFMFAMVNIFSIRKKFRLVIL